MVLNFELGDSLKEKLLSLGFKGQEAKEFIKEIDKSLEENIKGKVEDNIAKNLKDLATKEDILLVKEDINKLDKKLDKFDVRMDRLESRLDKYFFGIFILYGWNFIKRNSILNIFI